MGNSVLTLAEFEDLTLCRIRKIFDAVPADLSSDAETYWRGSLIDVCHILIDKVSNTRFINNHEQI